ncbi:uncharacterized protein P884DRAFT_248989 [Thermothelomyces heterothallicus CBS 202.75]|uniref:uncharacterized protein n=1 Tax=Thermothelomyces heterothallicus CBS 202.75 TaxID=1149848 RepID=UPI003743A77F
MLSDQEIERAAGQLAEFKRSDTLSRLLDQYSVLIEEYKRLKSDYEEEREAREKYKQMAKDQERNPFVLVLIDGDGYIFNDTLLSQRAEGGSLAAQMLNDEVKASLRRKGLEHCQIMVRIYANVLGLSKALAKTGVVSSDSRSLAPFIASFNRSYGLTDFVDAGQLKENADFKIRALLRLYADNSQCKHIYFAACHDVGYVSELMPFMGNSSKFTLVNTPGNLFHDEFGKLGMGIEEFRNVFRHSPIDGSAAHPQDNSNLGGASRTVSAPSLPPKSPTKSSATSTADQEQKKACLFFSMGKCRYGKSCRLLHVSPTTEPQNTKQSTDQPSSHSPKKLENSAASLDLQLSKLPIEEEIPDGCVMVNENNHRIDPRLPFASAGVINRLKTRVNKRRICNRFHLQGFCEAGDRCEYDHETLDQDLLPALVRLARSQPCPRRGECRLEGCSRGHICQNLECRHRGGKLHCRIPYSAHLEPLIVARYIPSVPRPSRQTNSDSGSSATSDSISE